MKNFEIQRERREWDSLRQLTYYTARELFGWSGAEEKNLAERVLREVAIRNAKTIAAWQVWGFMHGMFYQVPPKRIRRAKINAIYRCDEHG
jgi:uncharacterized protein YdiU (UPF0061 family)